MKNLRYIALLISVSLACSLTPAEIKLQPATKTSEAQIVTQKRPLTEARWEWLVVK